MIQVLQSWGDKVPTVEEMEISWRIERSNAERSRRGLAFLLVEGVYTPSI